MTSTATTGNVFLRNDTIFGNNATIGGHVFVGIAIVGSLVGALYPAWRASAIDPVEVMANE